MGSSMANYCDALGEFWENGGQVEVVAMMDHEDDRDQRLESMGL